MTKSLRPIHKHDRKHRNPCWLVMADSLITEYDSLMSKRQMLSKSAPLQVFARTLTSRQQEWTVTLAKCPQQSNSYDCGIYVTVNAFFVIARMFLRATYNGNAWRLICSCLLHSVVGDDQLEISIGIAEQGNTIDPTLNGPQIKLSDESTVGSLQ